MAVRVRSSHVLLGVGCLLVLTTSLGARAESEDDARARQRVGVADHVPDTTIAIELQEGDWLTAGTCGLPGARAEGDTTLRVQTFSGVQVAYNDDACRSLASRLVLRAPHTGTYRLLLGCVGGISCGGRVAWQVDDHEVELPDVVWSGGAYGRAMIGPDGQGLVADGWLAAHIDAFGGFVVRLSGAPLGLAGGGEGGLLGGALTLTVGWDIGLVEVALGGGVSTLSRRADGQQQHAVGTFASRVRFGLPSDFHVHAQLLLGVLSADAADATFDGQAVLPIDDVEIVARGVYGMSGVWLGEVGVVWWPAGETRRGVGLAFLAGGSAVYYQPVCRYGLVCQQSTYAGPHVGFGLEVRP